MSSFLKEFKEFAVKGNVMDLATGVMIGAAFQKIITSLVNDILMPPIGLMLGKTDFSNLFINLSDTDVKTIAEAKAAGIPTINYGLFFNEALNFVIIAGILFLIVRTMNKLRRKQEKEEAKKA